MLGSWVGGSGAKKVTMQQVTTAMAEKEPDTCVLNRILAEWDQVCMCVEVAGSLEEEVGSNLVWEEGAGM